jgi:hypothetical protein
MKHVYDQVEEIQANYVRKGWITILSFISFLIVIAILDFYDQYRENKAKLELNLIQNPNGLRKNDSGIKLHVQ